MYVLYRITNIIIIVLFTILFFGCTGQEKESKVETSGQIISTILDTSNTNNERTFKAVYDTTDFEKILIKAGLVNIHNYDTAILVDLKYSQTDNFVGIDMYGAFDKAYFQEETVLKILSAQKYLTDTLPGFRLIIYDATRPRSIQQIMWDNFNMPDNRKRKYLAHPKYASMHSYGIAVDLNIVDDKNQELDMGTDFDSFEELAYPIFEEKMLKAGRLNQKQYNNRKLLHHIMSKAGFNGITTEWWHYSLYGKIEASNRYAIIETHILPDEKEPNLADLVTTEPISRDTKISFKVQIKTSLSKLESNSSVFKGLDIYTYHHEGMYKYTTGSFNKIADAYAHRDKIKEMGFHDCFVAGFNNNIRISIKEAVDLAE